MSSLESSFTSLKAMHDFFSYGRMSLGLNQIEIVNILKVSGLEELSHFRLPSLCNFLYKIISKVLVNRLKHFLSSLISS